DQILLRHALTGESRRLAGNGLGGRQSLARQTVLRHRHLVDGPDRFAGHPVQHVGVALFGDLGHRLDGAAIHLDVDQVGGGRIVEIPYAVVHRLEVPDTFAGTRVQADDALAEQVVAWSMAAVEVVG